MAKLSNLKPKLSSMGTRLTAPPTEQGRDQFRAATQPWRSWYKLKAWLQLRQQVFVRDGFICQRSGVLCIGKHPAPNSPVANHKKPHRGDPTLFWDINNIETVSKAVHDSIVQAEEARMPRGTWY